MATAAASVAAPAPPAAAATGAAPPPAPGPWRRALWRHATLTNALSLAFIAYFANALANLYRVAVPAVPSLTRPDGSVKPALESLWLRSAPAGIDVEMLLSTSSRRVPSDEVLLYRRTGVEFGWKLAFELEMSLELVERPPATNVSGGSGSAPAKARLVGLRAVCAHDATAACKAAAAAAAAGAAPNASASAQKPSLVVGEWESPAAVAVARALRAGAPVYLHASAAWAGAPPAGAADPRRRGDVDDSLRTATAVTSLVADAAYVRPKPLRYLWAPPLTREAAEAAARAAEAGARVRRHSSAPRRSLVDPVSGAPWPHWMGTADVHLIMDTAVFPRDEVPPALRPFLRTDAQRTVYAPLMAANPVRPTRERMHALNGSLTHVPLQLRFSPTAIGTWQLLQLMDGSITTQQRMGATERDTDDVIRLLVETPLWLLGVTFVVSVVHILFDVLALKNDIAFWQAAKSLRGISVRSLSISLVSNLVITAYLAREGSSLLVLVPQVATTALLVWKIALASGIVWRRRFLVLPWPAYDAALHASAVQGASAAYDNEAVSYLSLVVVPLLLGFAAYSLAYLQFDSWAEYALSTAVSAVYGFGFILMCPQLWINYKLKSVAALPWAVLGYRFFNTVIDDVFASIIKMPMMHRVSVFRDDVVFLVYMVQRWYYPVDLSRPTEGFDDDDDTRAAAPKAAAATRGGGGGGERGAPAEAAVRAAQPRAGVHDAAVAGATVAPAAPDGDGVQDGTPALRRRGR